MKTKSKLLFLPLLLVGCSNSFETTESLSSPSAAASGLATAAAANSTVTSNEMSSTEFASETPKPAGTFFTAVNFEGVMAGEGHIGVDITWPMNGKSHYNPCHEQNGGHDINYGACVMAAVGPVSYYSVVNYFENGTNNFPLGIFVNSWDKNQCRGQPWCKNTGAYVEHGWSSLVAEVALEIYPKSKFYGGLRTSITSFPHNANGGRYSNPIGKIALPNELGNSATLNGFITFMGGRVDSKRVSLDFFQEGGDFAVSTTGHRFFSFASTNTNDEGYYNSGILMPGRYKIYVTDKGFNKKWIFHRDIRQKGELINFELNAHCFGQQPCEAE